MSGRFLFFLLVLLPALASGFGKNKVNLKAFKWLTLDSTHCRIYYPAELKHIANKARRYAQTLVFRYQRLLRHDIGQSIPIIIFPSHPDFEENNLTPGGVGEQTGGFTELLRCRVVLPYDGSWRRFKRVLAHEMVHAFQFDILFGNRGTPFGRLITRTPPLWFLEGMAEYISIGWDPTIEATIRDGVIRNTLPSMDNLDKLRIHPKQYMLVYKQGQAFLHFLSEKYGKNTIPELIHVFRTTSSADRALRMVCGEGLSELSRLFFERIRSRYYPAYSRYIKPEARTARYTDHKKDGSSYNAIPSISPDGKYYAYLSNKDFFPAIYLASRTNGKILKRIAISWRGGDYTGLLFQGNRITWSPDSRRLAFLSRIPEGYALSIHQRGSGKRLYFAPLPGGSPREPVFSPDGRKILFITDHNGTNQLCLHTPETGKTAVLVTSPDQLANPRFTTQGGVLLLRIPDRFAAPTRFVLFDTLSRQVLPASLSNTYPAFSRLPGTTAGFDLSGTTLVALQSTAEGQDIWLLRPGQTRPHRITRASGFVGPPSIGERGKFCFFSEYRQHGYDISAVELKQPKPLPDEITPSWGLTKLPEIDTALSSFKGLPGGTNSGVFRSRLNLDLVNGIVGFNSAAGARIIGQMAMSDMLGDRRLSLTVDLSLATGGEESGKSTINTILNYYLLKGRMDLMLGLFRYSANMFYFDFQSIINSAFTPVPDEDQGGAFALFRYPFSRFSRIDIFWTSMYFKKYYIDLDSHHDALKHILNLSYVFDNTAWGLFGPMDGIRVRFSLENAFNLWGEDWQYQKAEGDFRVYLRFFKRYALAFRLAGGIVRGPHSHYNGYELGGFYTVRGYPFYSIRGDTMLLANLELRFPLIDFLALGFPFPMRIARIHGVIFFDAAAAWNKGNDPVFWTREDGVTRFRDLRISYGVGFRFLLGPFRIRWDFAAPYDGDSPRPLKRWLGLFSLGMDF